MLYELYPSTERIRAVVAEEMAELGGTVSDCFDDGHRLFLRAVLPGVREVRPRDGVRGGVAVMTTDENIRVCPYLFRQVCRNGAIMPQVIRVRNVQRLPQASPEAEQELRQEIRACSSAGAFSGAVAQMQSAATRQANHVLYLFPVLLHMPHLAPAIRAQFAREDDHSALGLINAITAVARDEPDPQTRWRLEELGGSIPALLPPTPRRGGAAARPRAEPALAVSNSATRT